MYNFSPVDSNTGDPSGGNPWVPTPGPGPADPGGNQNGSNGGEDGETEDGPKLIRLYITAYPKLFEDAIPDGAAKGSDPRGWTSDETFDNFFDYFKKLNNDGATTYNDFNAAEVLALTQAFFGGFSISYEGDAPNVGGIEVYGLWDDNVRRPVAPADLKFYPPVLGQAYAAKAYDEFYAEFGIDLDTDPTDQEENLDAIYIASLKKEIFIYLDGYMDKMEPVYIPIVIPIDRGSNTGGVADWSDIAEEVAAIPYVYEDDEFPVLANASVKVKYPVELKIGGYADGSDDQVYIELATGVASTGFKAINLGDGHVFADYVDGFGTSSQATSPDNYRSGIVAMDEVYVLISRAALLTNHGGTGNESVFLPISVATPRYIRQVELNKALVWNNGGDPYYLQGQAPAKVVVNTNVTPRTIDDGAIFPVLVTAGIELKVTYSDGTSKVRGTAFVKRAHDIKNAMVVDYESGNGISFSKFEDDYAEGRIGYLTFAYYSSLIPGFARRGVNNNGYYEGDYSNFVFDYGKASTGDRPRVPIALYQPGDAVLELNTGYSEPDFVGRRTARDKFLATNYSGTGMTDAEFDRIRFSYTLKGNYLTPAGDIVQKVLIPATAWENDGASTGLKIKGWFNGGRDPFVNRDERPYSPVNVPFTVPSDKTFLDLGLLTYRVFAGEETSIDVKVYVYDYDPTRPNG